MLRIALLGELAVRDDDRLLPLPSSKKARLVLALLAAHRGRVARARIAGQFWDDEGARNSVSGELKHLRKLLGPLLAADRESVGLLTTDELWIDIREFDARIEREEYRDALRLVRGDFLQDLSHPWADAERTTWRRKVAHVADRLAATTEDLAEALAAARQAHDLLPNEALYQERLARRLYEAGDPIAARKELDALFRRCAQAGVILPARVSELSDEISGGPVRRTHGGGPSRETASTDPQEVDANRRIAATGESVGEDAFTAAPAGPLFTGLTDLDELIHGLPQPGLTVIAGRPGMGATTLALTVSFAVAIEQQQTVAIFSPDLNEQALARRMIGMQARVSADELRLGRVKADRWPKVIRATERLTRASMYVDDSPDIDLEEFKLKLDRLGVKLGAPPRLVVIDDAYLLGRAATLSDTTAIGGALSDLAGVARVNNIAIVITTKVLPGVESRADKRPLLRDVPGLQEAARSPDLVLFVYRDDYYYYESEHPGEIEIIVAANRDGPVGLVRAAFIQHTLQIANLYRETA